jgi:hypothetical protein
MQNRMGSNSGRPPISSHQLDRPNIDRAAPQHLHCDRVQIFVDVHNFPFESHPVAKLRCGSGCVEGAADLGILAGEGPKSQKSRKQTG